MRSSHSDWLAHPTLAALVVALGVAITTWPLVVHPGWVPLTPRSPFTDLLISHLPFTEFLRASLIEYGQVPLWNPLILAGMPFAADPLAGLWYPPNWLLVVLPLPLGFNLMLLAHLAWGGLGTWALLRALGASSGPALLGALTFAGLPKQAAHLAAGHVSLVFAVAWTPWALLAARQAARTGGWRAGALAGATVAVTTLADVRWGAYTAAAAGAYWLASLPWARRRVPGTNLARTHGLSAGIGLALAALLVAGLALPLAELMPYTTRSALRLDEVGLYSLPWTYFLGLIIPPLAGFHEYLTYLGVLPLLAALLGLRRGNWFWAGMVVTAAALSLGTNFPLYALIYRLVPGVAWLRVPARAWFLVGLGVAVLAGLGAEWLVAQGLPSLAARWRRPHLAGWSAARIVPALAVLTVLDLARVNGTLITMQPRPGLAPAAAWLQAETGYERFRVFSSSYSLPAGDGLEHLDAVSPLQIGAVAQAVNAAAGTRAPGYSVPVPPLEGDVATANAQAVPDAAALGLFNVAYVAVEYPLEAPGLELAATFGDTRVYRNRLARPRAWVEGQGGDDSATLVAWSPNHLEIAARGPGKLVLSEVAFPGWEATIDGQPARIDTAYTVLRALDLGPGSHRVRLDYRPRSVYAGAALSALGWLGLVAIGLWPRREQAR